MTQRYSRLLGCAHGISIICLHAKLSTSSPQARCTRCPTQPIDSGLAIRVTRRLLRRKADVVTIGQGRPGCHYLHAFCIDYVSIARLCSLPLRPGDLILDVSSTSTQITFQQCRDQIPTSCLISWTQYLWSPDMVTLSEFKAILWRQGDPDSGDEGRHDWTATEYEQKGGQLSREM